MAIQLTFRSQLRAPAPEVWSAVSTMAGVNHELRPLIRMTHPPEWQSLDQQDDVPDGVIFHSWLLLERVVTAVFRQRRRCSQLVDSSSKPSPGKNPRHAKDPAHRARRRRRAGRRRGPGVAVEPCPGLVAVARGGSPARPADRGETSYVDGKVQLGTTSEGALDVAAVLGTLVDAHDALVGIGLDTDGDRATGAPSLPGGRWTATSPLGLDHVLLLPTSGPGELRTWDGEHLAPRADVDMVVDPGAQRASCAGAAAAGRRGDVARGRGRRPDRGRFVAG